MLIHAQSIFSQTEVAVGKGGGGRRGGSWWQHWVHPGNLIGMIVILKYDKEMCTCRSSIPQYPMVNTE